MSWDNPFLRVAGAVAGAVFLVVLELGHGFTVYDVFAWLILGLFVVRYVILGRR